MPIFCWTKRRFFYSFYDQSKIFYSYGFDRDGLPIRDDLLFDTREAAARFELCVEQPTSVQRLFGFETRIVETQCIALWDYYGGDNALDLNCNAGDILNVLAEEFQSVFCCFLPILFWNFKCVFGCRVRSIDDGGGENGDGGGGGYKERGAFLRLPRLWSLARWMSNKRFQPTSGLIPSCWLVPKTFFDGKKRSKLAYYKIKS